MEEKEYEFYDEITKVGNVSHQVIIPKNVIEASDWKAGDTLKIRCVRIKTKEVAEPAKEIAMPGLPANS